MPEQILMVPVADIATGGRARKEFRHIEALAESVATVGMLHPLVLNTAKQLIAGARRLEAAKRLGWTEVPCRVVSTLDDALNALIAERDENNCRDPLTPTEMVELGRQIEAVERPKAKERHREGSASGGKGSGKLPEPSRGQTRDKVGAALGVSGKTYEKAKAVADAAEKQPDLFGDLPALMDEASVSAAHNELVRRKEEAEAETEQPVEEEAEQSPAEEEHRPSFSEWHATLPTREELDRKKGLKPGNNVDADSPLYEVMKALTAVSRAVNKAIDADETGFLKDNLSQFAKISAPMRMVAHRPGLWKDGQHTPATTKFVGLALFRAFCREVGKRMKQDKPKGVTPKQIRKLITDINAADENTLLDREDAE